MVSLANKCLMSCGICAPLQQTRHAISCSVKSSDDYLTELIYFSTFKRQTRKRCFDGGEVAVVTSVAKCSVMQSVNFNYPVNRPNYFANKPARKRYR